MRIPEYHLVPSINIRTLRNFNYSAVHADGAARIAHIAKQEGVERLVHVSHLNAAPDSKSAFYRAKFEGEERVKEAFPEATIIRPSIMYGYEDKLLNNMASACTHTPHSLHTANLLALL